MLNVLKQTARRLLRPPLHRPEVKPAYDVLGTEYGGWPLLRKETSRGALIYSFGIGEDISFDLAAIAKYGCRVRGFDPTPKSMTWLQAQSLPADFTFHPVGIGNHDGEANFFAPVEEGHVSFSASPNPTATQGEPILAKVMRLQSIVASNGGEPPVILKMDIEGFEYDVIFDILDGLIRPQQFLVEFHHGMYGIPSARTIEAVQLLRGAGYKLFYVSSGGHEYAFVHGDE